MPNNYIVNLVLRLRFALFTLILLSLLIAACSKAVSTTATQIAETTELIKITPSETPIIRTKTTQPTITVTLSPRGYSDLPDGEYILYESGKDLNAISVLDQSSNKIYDRVIYWPKLSQNQKELILEPSGSYDPLMINLETMVQKEISFLRGCYNIYYLDENDTFLAVCKSPDDFFELFRWSQDGKQKAQLTNCGAFEGECGKSFYSPDGEWITYRFGPAGAGQSSKSGFYITSSTCVDQALKCGEMAIGPFDVGANYSWAPNSQYIASSGDEGISIFELKNNEIKAIREIETPTGYVGDEILWSPDSSYITYTYGNEIWLVEVIGGIPRLFQTFNNGVYLIGWVKIKDGKVSP